MSDKVVVELDKYEQGAITRILLNTSNQMKSEKKDTQVVNELLKKVVRAPSKKKKAFSPKEKKVKYER